MSYDSRSATVSSDHSGDSESSRSCCGSSGRDWTANGRLDRSTTTGTHRSAKSADDHQTGSSSKQHRQSGGLTT